MTDRVHARRALGALLLLSVLVALAPARADWPAPRHDAQRTSTGDLPAHMDRVALGWRHYLGGALGSEQYVALDVAGDAAPEIVFVMGGALVAKTPDDVTVWESGSLDLLSIAGVHDLDGDGVREIVAPARAGRVYVLRASDGGVLWSLDPGVVGNVGNLRFADFDGDSRLDLYLADAACGSTGSLGDVGIAFSFSGGYGAPRRLFELERGRRDYVCGQNDTIVDIDGDGALEVVAQGVRHFYVYSTADGSLESESEDVGSIPYGLATTNIADVDLDDRPELVCFTENTYAPPVNSRRVFLMGWDSTAGRLVKRWERTVADTLDDRHGWFPGGTEDLLDDGSTQVATSFYDAATSRWTTMVLDGATGAILDSVPRGPFGGLVDLDGDGSSEILTGDHVSGLDAFRWTATGLERVFTAPSVDPIVVRDERTARVASDRWRALGHDVDRDGANELVALEYAGEVAVALVALGADADPPTERARLPIETNVALLTFEPFDNVTRPYPQLLVARSDGFLWVLDDAFAPTNHESGGEISSLGMRIGGYYSGASGTGGPVPVAGDLDADGAADVLARDSRGVLLRLSASGASLVEPPTIAWQLPHALLPTITDVDHDGTPEIALWVDAPVADEVQLVHAADGSPIWRSPVGTMARGLSGDIIVGRVSADAVDDVAFQLYSSSGGTVLVNVLGGGDGARLWPSDYETVVAGSGLGIQALADRDGDGRMDVLATPRNLLQWLAGTNGAALESADGGYPGHPILHDIDGDGALEILSSGSVYGSRAFELDLTSVWTDAMSGLHTRILGAVARCADGPRFVQGHINSARVTVRRADTGAVTADVALRDGRLYDPYGTVPSGPGVVGNVTVSPDLVGAGRPSALVPSTDGFLYAIDPCTGRLDWSLDFRFPVGEAILADTDGDGEDEIVVTVADGYIYGVDREVIAAPVFVAENDGTRLATGPGDDIDEVATVDTLWANWASVVGATSYEYAVITPGGTFLTRPSFVNVGAATNVTASGLPLAVGRRYLFAVRAIGPEGSSSEAVSDGVVVLAPPPDPCATVTCGPGERCVAGTCTRNPGGGEGGLPDAGTPGPDGGPAPGDDGGCGCVTAGAPRARGPGLLAFALGLGAALALATRRRRTGGRARARRCSRTTW